MKLDRHLNEFNNFSYFNVILKYYSGGMELFRILCNDNLK